MSEPFNPEITDHGLTTTLNREQLSVNPLENDISKFWVEVQDAIPKKTLK